MKTEQKNETFNYEKAIEKVVLEYRIRLNKELYEDECISFDIYQKMEEYLIKKLNNLNKNY